MLLPFAPALLDEETSRSAGSGADSVAGLPHLPPTRNVDRTETPVSILPPPPLSSVSWRRPSDRPPRLRPFFISDGGGARGGMVMEARVPPPLSPRRWSPTRPPPSSSLPPLRRPFIAPAPRRCCTRRRRQLTFRLRARRTSPPCAPRWRVSRPWQRGRPTAPCRRCRRPRRRC
ncbi:hypothetical protein BU14_0171s0016 [Porphyra umbilicalis]|uniref:Uncharacterized protein n=1 Tax=Porphyra umbilicalis TaxID=2786 RepID=A0A1X6P7S0_PORUM|nr:hypothetical protein BU14_0171s0016 [Porphyra umbilicalis]|eukprot:OSX76867.1 hypothetical protein BU14_0171s0016 [Porphyra umbilicalis]